MLMILIEIRRLIYIIWSCALTHVHNKTFLKRVHNNHMPTDFNQKLFKRVSMTTSSEQHEIVFWS